MIKLQALAELAGIQTAYRDIWGKEHQVSDATILALLKSLGFSAQTEEALDASHTQLAESYKTPLPLVKVLQADKTNSILVRGAIRWELMDEKNNTEKGECWRERVKLPVLAIGYYHLRVFLRDEVLTSTLIVAPPECWIPETMKQGKRVWGIAAQLYSLRTAHNMGIGDLSDLTELVKNTAKLGCDLIGLNPLHAMFPNNPAAFSPYAPSNRLFLNVLYIDMQTIENFASCAEAQNLWNSTEFQNTLHKTRSEGLVNYTEVAKLKSQLLKLLFDDFLHHNDQEKYQKFCEQAGEKLQLQATFDALSEHFNIHWHEWPVNYQTPHTAEVKTFAENNKEKIEYYSWLQFIADSHLAKAQATALQAGMQIGLYRDLAVGPEGAGAEIWLDASHFMKNVSVGVPPDEYNPKGQNWGLPAFNPFTLQERGLQPFIELVQANMRHARALRIDHAFGLSRLYLIPHGGEEGAYINYPFEAMLAVLRAESHRNNCIVIGEDLGTFPPNYKGAAASAGLFSYKVLYFEHDDKQFTPPTKYPAQALATLSTHDLPNLKGWLSGADQEERSTLSLYPSQELELKDRENRKREKILLEAAIKKEGLGEVNTISAQSFLARSPAAIVMVQLEDVLGMEQQMNMPATTSERPNWRMKLPKTLEEIVAPQSELASVASYINAERAKPLIDIPRATYRLQFHKDFTFDDAVKIIPYLAELGISHVYASPYLQARPGSTHGYDITDHNKLNPELGGEEEYARFTDALEKYGLKQILDFVPNHMGVGSDNHWWVDVLAWGKDSPYARYFDIDWQPRYGKTEHKILLPVLGNHYGDVLVANELKLVFDPEKGSFYIEYFTQHYPICPVDYHFIVPELEPIKEQKEAEEYQKQIVAKRELYGSIQKAVEKFNQDNESLHELLERQYYRLAFWRVAASEINYRRFFDINELAGMCPEEPEVFDAMHRLVFQLIDEGKIHALRIDHIDGLADPKAYCNRLKEKAGVGLYLTVEKILATHENLRNDWNIEGTSGYYALNQIANLFVAQENEAAFSDFYAAFTHREIPLADMVFDAKCTILETSLASELLGLSLSLKRVAEDRYNRDYTLDMLTQALKELIGYFPVYRSYVTAEQVTSDDVHVIDWAYKKAKKQTLLPDSSVYDFIAGLLKKEENASDELTLTFIRKFQQLSGPVMAKGLEDTSFYRYNRLLSLNEVGGDPLRFGVSVNAFHHINENRQKTFPHTMIATATHDTKRGEDARCRISMLSHMPDEWQKLVNNCANNNRSYHKVIDGYIAPSKNEEYAIYQALIGSWPVELMEQPLNTEKLAEFSERLMGYITKSLREAKERSNWAHPNEEYEKAVQDFVRALLDNTRPNKFLDEFIPFAKQVAQGASLTSLEQLVLKLTMPGVPDIYQGTEYWDLSLVDPDNRRPVNYQARVVSISQKLPISTLLQDWQSGVVKQRVMQLLLHLRKKLPDLFTNGLYEKVSVTGEGSEAIVAYSRTYADEIIYVIIPLTHSLQDMELDIKPGNYYNILAENVISISATASKSRDLFEKFPIAVLLRQKD